MKKNFKLSQLFTDFMIGVALFPIIFIALYFILSNNYDNIYYEQVNKLQDVYFAIRQILALALAYTIFINILRYISSKAIDLDLEIKKNSSLTSMDVLKKALKPIIIMVLGVILSFSCLSFVVNDEVYSWLYTTALLVVLVIFGLKVVISDIINQKIINKKIKHKNNI